MHYYLTLVDPSLVVFADVCYIGGEIERSEQRERLVTLFHCYLTSVDVER